MTDHNWRDLVDSMEPKRKSRVDKKVKRELRRMRFKEWWLEVPNNNRLESAVFALLFIAGGGVLGWLAKTLWGN